MSRAKGVMRGPVTPSISHAWINSMGWPRSNVFSEDCKKKKKNHFHHAHANVNIIIMYMMFRASFQMNRLGGISW